LLQCSNTWRLLLLRYIGLFLLIFGLSNSLSAQKILSGSGSTMCGIPHGLGIFQNANIPQYDDDPISGRIEYVVCPSDTNKMLVKVAITKFDVAPGDTLTIYEGCGVTNTIVASTYAGGASAATALPSSWVQADCDNSSGCLTFVFAPNGDTRKGCGLELFIDCVDRPAEVICPQRNITIPSACGINHTNSVAAIYTIPRPTTTCTYDPLTMPTNLMVTTTIASFSRRLRASEADLVANGDYVELDGVAGLSPGDKIFLEMGDYDFSYSYMPISSSTASETCTFTVTVDEIAPVCNNQVNISLNTSTCSAQLNADMLIEGDDCWVGYTTNILDGVDAGTDIVTYDNVGKTIKVEVATPSGNKCWGLVLVEDKAPPTFTCRDTAIYCGIDLNPTISNLFPTDGKDCTSFTFEFIDGIPSSYGCNNARIGSDADTVGIIQRTWTAIDAAGSRSTPCVQNIYRLRPHLTSNNIVWPKDTTFYCSDNPDRNFPPTITGFPQVDINGQLINLETTCLFGIDYDDTDFTTDCEGVVKKGRIWTIIDWCGSGNGLSVIQSDTQLIKMIDTVPPVLVGEPITLEHFSSHGACSAHVIFPAITVTDACTPSTSYKVQGPLSTIFHTVGSTAPDTMWNVPFGTHDFIYIGEDDCGNQTRHTINMEIKDLINPVAIVDERSNVSLTNDENQTWIFATSFDNGSHDNCGVTDFLARRMPDNPNSTLIPFTESVGFTCDDLGDTIMVQVQVIDACGNIGQNMTEVIIVDKNGVCECSSLMPQIAISGLTNDILCGGDIATLTASGGTNYAWAAPINVIDNNSVTSIVTVSPTVTTTYTVTVSDGFGCDSIQTVTIMGTPVLTATTMGGGTICSGTATSLIVTPTGGTAPYTFAWSGSTITSDTLPITPTASTTYMVTVTDANGCSIVESIPVTVPIVPIDPQVIGASANGSVCVGESVTLTPFNNTINNQGNYTYNWAPSGATTFSIMPTVGVTTTYIVTVTEIATNCTSVDSVIINTNPLPDAAIKVGGVVTTDTTFCEGEMLDLVACGGTSYVWNTGANTDDITIENDSTYTVTVTDENGCMAVTSIVVARTDLSAPIQTNMSICPEDSIQLIPNPVNGLTYTWSADTNATTFVSADTMVTPEVTTEYFVTITDGFCVLMDSVIITVSPETEIQVLSERAFEADQTSNIIVAQQNTNTTIVSYSWNPTTNLDLTNPAMPIFDPQNQIGVSQFFVTVTDNFGCMVEDSTGMINVTAPMRPAPMATLSGTISTEEGEMVERTTINLTDYDMPAQVTGATGDYGFQEVPLYENYTVVPEKDMNPLNGVSTYDLVLISKHILGITSLDSPYKMIAADINRSGTITAFDMVQLRQLILNINDDFANNTSWRFVDAAYVFTDPTNPFIEAIPETYNITDLTVDMTWLDFIAIKIGDVNNSAVVNNLMTTESRAATKSLDFQAKQGLSEDGQYLIFDFTANNFNAISGYQFALQFDPQVIAFDKIVPSSWVNKDNFGLAQIERGQIATSWSQAEGVDIDSDEVLFSLVFQINGEVTTDELLEIADTDLKAEAYDANGDLLNVHLIDSEIAPQVAAKSIQLFQNRPNPFTGKTTIGFALPEASEATLRIFDTAGKMIQIYDGYYEKGYNELIISSQELTQYGALYYQLATPTQVATMKMIHAK